MTGTPLAVPRGPDEALQRWTRNFHPCPRNAPCGRFAQTTGAPLLKKYNMQLCRSDRAALAPLAAAVAGGSGRCLIEGEPRPLPSPASPGGNLRSGEEFFFFFLISFFPAAGA